MKSRIFSFLIFAGLSLFLLMSSMSFVKNDESVFADDVSSQIKALEKDLSGIEKDRLKAEKALKSAKNSQATQMVLKRQYDNEISTIVDLISTTDELIASYDIEIGNLETKLTDLRLERDEELESFDDLVRMTYMYGDESYLEILFGARSFADFLTRLDMVSYLLSYSDGVVDGLNEIEVELIETEKSLVDSKSSLEDYKESKSTLLSDFEKKSAEANALITSYGKDVKSAEAALKVIEDSKKQLEKDIAELAAKSKNDGTPYSGGIFIWPVNQSRNAYISSGWEWRTNPITKKKEFHNGLDIPAPAGTKIFAASNGVVEKSAWYGGYGNCVIISHGGGVRTLYGHCSKLLVSEGQTVKKGDTIALVGTTGMSTGNHLHFTVYEKGSTAVNPWNYLNG